jgi:hypothetical protein
LHGTGSKIAAEDRGYLTDDELIEEARRLYGGDNFRIARMQSQPSLF